MSIYGKSFSDMLGEHADAGGEEQSLSEAAKDYAGQANGDLPKAYDAIVKELGWHGTAEELFTAIKGPFNEDVCRWVYGLGNSKRQEDIANGYQINAADQRRLAEESWAEWKVEHPTEASQIDEAKLRQYLECFMDGYEGKKYEGGDDNTWMWGLGIVTVLGLGGWWLVKKGKI